MVNDPNEALSRRVAEVTADGEASFTGEIFKQALTGVAWQLQNRKLTQDELVQDLAHPNAAGKIFARGIDGLLDKADSGDKAAESAYRAYRDSLPDRKRWRERDGKR